MEWRKKDVKFWVFFFYLLPRHYSYLFSNTICSHRKGKSTGLRRSKHLLFGDCFFLLALHKSYSLPRSTSSHRKSDCAGLRRKNLSLRTLLLSSCFPSGVDFTTLTNTRVAS